MKDKDKFSIEEQYAEEYCDLLRLNIGPISRNDIVRAFITGWRAGELHQASKELEQLVEYNPEDEDA